MNDEMLNADMWWTGEGGTDPTSLYEQFALTTGRTQQLELCQSTTEQGCKWFTFVVYVIIQGVMFTLGFIGNTISFFVLQSDRKSHAATFLLQVMAIIDNLFLLATGFAQTFTALTLFFGQTNHWLSVYLQVFVWPLVHITQLCTVCITVLIACNRYVAICHPYRAETLCSLKLVKLQVGVMILFVILYNTPRFFEFKLSCVSTVMTYSADTLADNVNTTATMSTDDWTSTTDDIVAPAAAAACIRIECETALKQNGVYGIVYENILYCMVVFLGPFVLLVVFNIAIVLELCRSHRERVANNGGGRLSLNNEIDERHERNNITLVMLVIIVVFLVTQTPAYINQLLYYFLAEDEYLCGHPYFYYYHVSNLIVSSSSCLNFVVYCACRRQFRDRLGDLRCCGSRCDSYVWGRCFRKPRESISSTSRSSGTHSTPTAYSYLKPNGVDKVAASDAV